MKSWPPVVRGTSTLIVGSILEKPDEEAANGESLYKFRTLDIDIRLSILI